MATIDNRVIERSKAKKGNGAQSQNHEHDSKVPQFSDVEHHNYKNIKGNINIQFSSKSKCHMGHLHKEIVNLKRKELKEATL